MVLTAAKAAAGPVSAGRLQGLSGAVHSRPCQVAGHGRWGCGRERTRVPTRAARHGSGPGATRQEEEEEGSGQAPPRGREAVRGAFGKRRARRAGVGAPPPVTTRAVCVSSRDRCSVGLSFLGEGCIVLARFAHGQSAAEAGVRASREPLCSGLRF